MLILISQFPVFYNSGGINFVRVLDCDKERVFQKRQLILVRIEQLLLCKACSFPILELFPRGHLP